jgi:hypothetical protein
MAITGLRDLCTPAYLYLVISFISLAIIMFQNSSTLDTYCMGQYSCKVSSTTMLFLIKFIYIIFWTWILNLICNAGATPIAWLLFLFPFILMFIFIAFFFSNNTNYMPTVYQMSLY